MVGSPYSAAVLAGTDATASDHNNARKDALTRWFKFEVLGTLVVANTQGGSYLIPFAGTVISTRTKTDSGTATVRINADATVVDSGIAVTSTAATDSTIGGTAAVTNNQVLTMDITAISAGVHLIVEVEILCSP